ncbi:MAG: hypothetical protein CMQ41_15785 [Gammaproteobacteria bacterium]|nr:hypothetical protein [Gammaproteobacteria bacterium]|tara:strand:+ start:355 stop:561 length:207 start_codon:yes stop_codon:yes gene_type:complete
MSVNEKLPTNIYALFADGERMSGTYGKLFFDRVSARAAKSKAKQSRKWSDHHITMCKVPVAQEWLNTH